MAIKSQFVTNSLQITDGSNTYYLIPTAQGLQILTPSQAAQYFEIAPQVGAQPASRLTVDPVFQDFVSPVTATLNANGTLAISQLAPTAASGSNQAGTSETIQGGQSTGTGDGGSLLLQSSPRGSSGSTANTEVSRIAIQGKRVSATSGAASTVATLTVPAGGGTGGKLFYAIYSTDGTDIQVRTASANWAYVNKAGTGTSDTDIDAATSIAASTGTLTATFSIDATAAAAPLLQVTPTTSLTATSLFIDYVLVQNGNCVVTLA